MTLRRSCRTSPAHLKPVGESLGCRRSPSRKKSRPRSGRRATGADGSNIRLVDVLNHAGLYEAYPFLQQMRVTMVVGRCAGAHRRRGVKYRVENGRTIYSPIVVRAANRRTPRHPSARDQHYIQKQGRVRVGLTTSERKVQPAGRRVGGKAAVGPKAHYAGHDRKSGAEGRKHRLSALTMGERAATLRRRLRHVG